MNLEDAVIRAIVAELERQAAAHAGRLKVTRLPEPHISIEGRVNLDELAMAVVGAVAGGP